jgi:hypothetical protein
MQCQSGFINSTFLEHHMKAKQLIAALSLIGAAGSVFAQQTEFVAPDAGFVSSKTRAEVAAEVKQASEQGLLVTNDAFPRDEPIAGKPSTREEVRASLNQPPRNGRDLHDGDIYFGA